MRDGLYGTKCCIIKRKHVHKISVTEMRISRWISGNTKKDRHQNEEIHSKIRVAPIDEKIGETCLRWFGHVLRRVTNDDNKE